MKILKALLDKNSSNFLLVGVDKKFVKDAFGNAEFQSSSLMHVLVMLQRI